MTFWGILKNKWWVTTEHPLGDLNGPESCGSVLGINASAAMLTLTVPEMKTTHGQDHKG
jgi:hypothetical protein